MRVTVKLLRLREKITINLLDYECILQICMKFVFVLLCDQKHYLHI